jgi:hypothetical protein
MKFLSYIIVFTSLSAVASPGLDKSIIDGYFKHSVIVDEAVIHFDERLIALPIKLTLCVGQDRKMSRTVKMLGCQNVKAEELLYGKVILDGFNFSQANRKRNLVYFLNWETLDPSSSDFKKSSVFIVIER